MPSFADLGPLSETLLRTSAPGPSMLCRRLLGGRHPRLVLCGSGCWPRHGGIDAWRASPARSALANPISVRRSEMRNVARAAGRALIDECPMES
jgi:hypothetical protein